MKRILKYDNTWTSLTIHVKLIAKIHLLAKFFSHLFSLKLDFYFLVFPAANTYRANI